VFIIVARCVASLNDANKLFFFLVAQHHSFNADVSDQISGILGSWSPVPVWCAAMLSMLMAASGWVHASYEVILLYAALWRYWMHGSCPQQGGWESVSISGWCEVPAPASVFSMVCTSRPWLETCRDDSPGLLMTWTSCILAEWCAADFACHSV